MTFPDVPEKNEFAKIVVRGLSKCAGTGDRATAIVEPVTGDAPIRGIGLIGHCCLSIGQGQEIQSVFNPGLSAIEQMHQIAGTNAL